MTYHTFVARGRGGGGGGVALYPGCFLRRKEPGSIGGVEPFTSGVSLFM